MMKLIRKYLRNGIFFLFVFVLIAYISLEVLAPNKTIDIFRFKSYVVVSSSMEPDIMVNDLIIIRKVKEEDLNVRDAITFDAFIPELGYESKVTHYIGEIQSIGGNTIYKTQGATNSSGDFDTWENENGDTVEITFDDIEGRVILVVPYFGHVINILRDPISILLISANILIVYLIIKTIKKPKEDKVQLK